MRENLLFQRFNLIFWEFFDSSFWLISFILSIIIIKDYLFKFKMYISIENLSNVRESFFNLTIMSYSHHCTRDIFVRSVTWKLIISNNFAMVSYFIIVQVTFVEIISELGTWEWWISGLMLNPLFLLISRLK